MEIACAVDWLDSVVVVAGGGGAVGFVAAVAAAGWHHCCKSIEIEVTMRVFFGAKFARMPSVVDDASE